jgi:hypothetical protein
MSVTLDWTSEPFVRYGKNKVVMMVTLVARNANEAMVAHMVGSGGVCF